MARQDTVDFVTAFAIGAVLGVGATLLLRSGREAETERILRELRPLRKRVRKHMQRAGRTATTRARAAEQVGDRIVETGRSVLGDFREQVSDIVDAARSELLQSARDTVKRAGEVARDEVYESARTTAKRARKAARDRMRR